MDGNVSHFGAQIHPWMETSPTLEHNSIHDGIPQVKLQERFVWFGNAQVSCREGLECDRFTVYDLP